MAPGPSSASPRRKARENLYLYEPGVRGRKTGLTVPDTGIRDEHGIEPMDELFSSPEKIQPKPKPRGRKPSIKKSQAQAQKQNPNATLISEVDMDIGNSTIPEPTTVLTERRRVSMRMPPPRSKSPIKTFLKSPARRHPSLGPVSSPTRGSIISPPRINPPPSVIRKLDFSADDLGNQAVQVVRSSPQKKNKVNATAPIAPMTNGSGSAVKPLKPAFQENISPLSARRAFNLASPNDEEEEEDDYQPINYDDQDLDDSQEVPAEPEPDPTPPKPTKKRARSPVTTARGLKTRPRRVSPELDVQEAESVAQEQSEASEQEEEPVEEELPPPKKQKKNIPLKKAQPIKKPLPISKPKSTKRRQLSPTRESSPPPIQHGPPRPRQNGLFILRRETPGLGNFAQTRSGRVSVKPVAYWKNEAVVYGEDEAADGDESFIMPTIKEVIRREEAASETPRKGKRRGPKPAKAAKQKKREELEPDSEDDADLAEPWESEPGRIYGEIRDWNPEDQVGVESAEREEEIAFSNAAIITREIPGSNVKFAKTLTLPFFGSGMVDLPPGAIKKPKNSRKMQMVFFVHYGRVNVTVNNNAFRIGKGGMWQVPRGNFYSIENDYDKPARIFFSQGCEVMEELPES